MKRLALAGEEALDVVALRAAVLHRLKDAGLPVIEEPARAPALPQLYLHVNASDAGRGLVPFTVRLEFYQAVLLARAPAQPIRASTWRVDLVGLVTQDQLSGVEEGVLGLTEAFIADFREGNP